METTLGENESLDVQWDKYVAVFCPDLAPFFLPKRDLGRINKQLSERNTKYKVDDPTRNGTTFYDLIRRQVPPFIGANGPRFAALGMLRFLNTQCATLMSHLHHAPALQGQLRNELSDLFQVNGDKYLDRVGELASRVYLLEHHPDYQVQSLCYRYEAEKKRGEKGPDADLFVEDTHNGERILIDVLSIQLDHTRIEDEEKLGSLIRQRLVHKKVKKRFTSTTKPAGFTCYVQPVIWLHDLNTENRFRSFFINFREEGVLPFLHLVQQGNGRSVIYSCAQFGRMLT